MGGRVGEACRDAARYWNNPQLYPEVHGPFLCFAFAPKRFLHVRTKLYLVLAQVRTDLYLAEGVGFGGALHSIELLTLLELQSRSGGKLLVI